MDRSYYIPDEEWNRILEFSKDIPTPCVIINPRIIEKNYRDLNRLFPFAKIYYAIKANPAGEIIQLLKEAGSNFDIASIHELDRACSIGVSPDRILYGNTIKKARDIKYFYEKGIRLFATDCISDVKNIAEYAPKSNIYVRIRVEGGETADWPLSKKFGCDSEKAISLIKESVKLGLNPVGISFHVGSQQTNIQQWEKALLEVASIFKEARGFGVELKMINMGGGFPCKYIQKVSGLEEYSRKIQEYLTNIFGSNIPEIILEPGRSLVGEAGVLISEVVMIARKSEKDRVRWVYLDTGRFNGLIETLDDSIKYPVVLENPRKEEESGDVFLAGPTCDSFDVMYEKVMYKMPMSLSAGEKLYWLTAGAYTTSYASIEFNGFPPIQNYFLT